MCLLPEFLISQFSVPFYFGGTSLLIIVVVIMDFMAQLQAHLMSHQYEGLMKKANLRGYGRPGAGALNAPPNGEIEHMKVRASVKDLQELQGRAPPRRGVRDLQRQAPQAAAGLRPRVH